MEVQTIRLVKQDFINEHSLELTCASAKISSEKLVAEMNPVNLAVRKKTDAYQTF